MLGVGFDQICQPLLRLLMITGASCTDRTIKPSCNCDVAFDRFEIDIAKMIERRAEIVTGQRDPSQPVVCFALSLGIAG